MQTPLQEATRKISTLWLVIVLNMIWADVLSLFIAQTDRSVAAIPGDPKVFMAIAAVIINIPIAMIYLSQTLSPRWNRVLNSIAGLVTIVFVVGGGSLLPHYLILGTIEVVLSAVIIVRAWQLKAA